MKTTPCPDCKRPHAVVLDDGTRVLVACPRAPRGRITQIADHPIGGQLWTYHPEDIGLLLAAFGTTARRGGESNGRSGVGTHE